MLLSCFFTDNHDCLQNNIELIQSFLSVFIQLLILLFLHLWDAVFLQHNPNMFWEDVSPNDSPA